MTPGIGGAEIPATCEAHATQMKRDLDHLPEEGRGKARREAVAQMSYERGKYEVHLRQRNSAYEAAK